VEIRARSLDRLKNAGLRDDLLNDGQLFTQVNAEEQREPGHQAPQ